MGEVKQVQRLWTAYLITNLIALAVVVGAGWTIVYYLAWIPLQEAGGISKLLEVLSEFKLSSTLWWRELLALAFDVLVIVLAFIGSWWSIGHFAALAREQRKWREYYKSEAGKRDVWIVRFTLWQRIQHLWIIITFVIDAFTGFVLYLCNNPYWQFLLVDRDLYIKIHVIDGWIMGVLLIFHFAYYGVQILLAKLRGARIMDEYPIMRFWMLVTFLVDTIRRLLWLVTPKVKKPKAHKYDSEQLFEYWGVYWGILVLAIPGAVMSIYGPQVLNGVFWVTHVKEAVLAITWILVVHIAYAHFSPLVFPMDTTYIHGKMPARRIKEEHELWYEELVRKGVIPAGGGKGGT